MLRRTLPGSVDICTLLGKNPPAARIASMSLLLISFSSTLPTISGIHNSWHVDGSSESTISLVISCFPSDNCWTPRAVGPINNRTSCHALLCFCFYLSYLDRCLLLVYLHCHSGGCLLLVVWTLCKIAELKAFFPQQGKFRHIPIHRRLVVAGHSAEHGIRFITKFTAVSSAAPTPHKCLQARLWLFDELQWIRKSGNFV